MADPKPPSRRSWKDAATGKGAGRGQARWQRGHDAPDTLGRRRRQLFVACSLLLVLLAAFIAVAIWPKAPPKAGLVLIGTAYENDLALPANYLGLRGLGDLDKQLCEGKGGLFRSTDSPAAVWHKAAEAPTEADFDPQKWVVGKGEFLLLFVSLHGAADGPKQPYFFLDDAEGKARFPVEKLLDNLENSNDLKQKHKLLLLDATQLSGSWPRGVLRNDFVAELKALLSDRRKANKDNNLWVLCASSEGQKSWPAEVYGQTAFAHFVLEGLRGEADGILESSRNRRTGRVTLKELDKYVRERVAQWVRDEHNAVQEPVLLPEGVTPEDDLELVRAPDEYESLPKPEPLPSPDSTTLAGLKSVWESCEDGRTKSRASGVYAPQVWRVYRAEIVRYEQAVRAGDTGRAAALQGKISDLKEEIERETQLALRDRTETFQSAGNALPLRATFGLTGDDRSTKLDAALRDLADPNRPGASDAEISPLRYTGRTRPAEAHLALMLWRDRPGGAANVPEEWGKDFKRAVGVRLRAEEAALSAGESSTRAAPHSYSEDVFPHVRERVEEADASRREGEDLLFASEPAHWAKAAEHLAKADGAYKQAAETGATVREALRVRDKAAAELPYYAQWLARRRLVSHKGADTAAADAIRLSGLTWSKLHQLKADLARPPRGKPEEGKAGASYDELKKVAQEVDNGLTSLEVYFRESYRPLLGDSRIQTRLQEIEDALTVPLIPTEERLALLQTSGKIVDKLRRGEGKDAANDKGDEAGATDASLATREGNLGRSSVGVVRLGQVADEALTRELEAGDFRAAGRVLGGAWLAAVEESRKALHAAGEAADPAEAARQAAGADDIARTLDDSGARLLSEGPIGPAKALRRLRVSELLRWQAQRTALDHWYEENPRADQPYYVAAANRYLDDARLLASSLNKQLDRLRQKAVGENVKATGISRPEEGPMRPPLTDFESKIPVDWSVRSEPGVPPGSAVLWAESAAPLRVTDGRRREPKALGDTNKANAQSQFDYDPKGGKPGAAGVQVTLHALYRGQRVDREVNIPLGPPPDVTAYNFPRRGSAFAVRAEQGALAGTVAIVLDGSPSMFYDDKPPYKYDRAVKALRTALGSLPIGTQFKIWRFGGDFDKQTEITEFPPLVWRGKDVDPDVERQLNNLAKYRANKLGWSPIVTTMKRALEDLKNAEGIKTLLVLSDGEDNEPEGKPPIREGTPPAEVRRVLRETFADSKVSIHFVLYHPEFEADIPKVRNQFQDIQNFDPPGRIYEKDKSALDEDQQLIKHLRDAMTPKVWLSKNGKPLRARSTDDEGFPITLPEAFSRGAWRWGGLDGQLPFGELDIRSYRLRSQMRLNEGDRLVLKLGRDNGGLYLKRATLGNVSRADNSHPRKNAGDNWTASMLLNRHRDGGLQQLLTLEETPADRAVGKPIEQVWPGFCWLDLAPESPAVKPVPVEWYLDYRYPAPTFAVNARRWPDGTPSRLSAWWSDSRIPPSEIESEPVPFRVTRGSLQSARVKLPGQTATVWAERRNQRVRVDPGGQKQDADCLILTVEANDPMVLARPSLEGFTGGEEHYYFTSLDKGYYQAVFWGIPGGDVVEFTLRLASLKAFKERVGKGGVRQVQLNADPPDRDDAASIDWVDVKSNPNGP
jgi:hypothetical protein